MVLWLSATMSINLSLFDRKKINGNSTVKLEGVWIYSFKRSSVPWSTLTCYHNPKDNTAFLYWLDKPLTTVN